MNMNSIGLALAAVLALAACGDRAAQTADGAISSLADRVAAEVHEEMAKKNFGLDGPPGLPKAELTPEGDLLIDGKSLALTAEQRALALAYRDAVIEIAQHGARIGLQGADVAKDAAAAAVAGVFSGQDSAAIEAKVRGSAERIRTEALALCDALPALLAKEQAFAQAVPEFAPYAEMTLAEIEDCRVDAGTATDPDPDTAIDAAEEAETVPAAV